jgi:phosphatidylinositol alpha-mannosyltransferase
MPKQNAAKPLKIGIVLDTSLDPPDGVQQYVLAVGEWLHSQGHDVHYVVGETTRTDLQNIHSLAKNIGVRFNGNRTTIPLPTSKRKLKTFLGRQQFDVLHVQTPHSPFFAQRLICAASPQTAVIATFHVLPDGRLPFIGNYVLGWWLRSSLRRIDQVLSVSPAAAEFARKTFGVTSTVLPNVFDYRLFHDAPALPQYAQEKKLTILFLGRLVPRKGCRYLLEAIAKLDKVALPSFRVVVCGKGPLLSQLQDFVQEHKLEEIVEFAGFVSEADKPRYYASADIAVFPSTGGESFGIVLIEAMAAGKSTVLAGNNPGYASVMGPQPELLFDPADTNALADQLSRLLTDAKARQAYAAWGSEYTKRFDIEVVGPQLVTLYTELLNQKNVQ